MKKSIIFIAVLALLTLGFTACEKESEGKTRITYYAELTLKGDATMIVEKGTEFKDPGCTAIMKGEDVSDQIKIASDVDTSTSGVYSVNYSIVNADGFVASATRSVIVLNTSSAIEGFYTSDPASYNVNNNSGVITPYGGEFDVLVIDNEDGTCFVDDLLAGWYAQRRGNGPDFAMQGKVAVDAGGKITLISSHVAYWNDGLDSMEDGQFDAATKTITYKVTYAGFLDFFITLNKVEL